MLERNSCVQCKSSVNSVYSANFPIPPIYFKNKAYQLTNGSKDTSIHEMHLICEKVL